MLNMDRDSIREQFFGAWKKYRNKEILSQLESDIVDVILLHPEYHQLFDNRDKYFTEEFISDHQENPFFHLGLHMTVKEQYKMNRPAGIQQIFQQLAHKLGDEHAAEHKIMEVAAEILWLAQAKNSLPDEQEYLEQLNKLISKTGS